MRPVLVALSLLLLAGCSSSNTPGPVGIGGGIHELKQSPCACTLIEQKIPDEMQG